MDLLLTKEETVYLMENDYNFDQVITKLNYCFFIVPLYSGAQKECIEKDIKSSISLVNKATKLLRINKVDGYNAYLDIANFMLHVCIDQFPVKPL